VEERNPAKEMMMVKERSASWALFVVCEVTPSKKAPGDMLQLLEFVSLFL
jgi:hypothetical protein